MTAEEATVTAGAEEAIEDKDKSSHRSIGCSNKDEGSNSYSSTGARSCEDPAVAGKFQ